MPRQITTTRTLTEIKLEAIVIDFSEAGPGQPPLVTVTYQVLDDAGRVFETKRLGGKSVPPGLGVALRAWWDQLVDDLTAEEGL
jgi:hypothetical protein